MKHENCALPGYYAASSGNVLPTFRDNLSVPSSWVKNLLKIGPIGCFETSVRNQHYSQRNNAEDSSVIYFASEAWKCGLNSISTFTIFIVKYSENPKQYHIQSIIWIWLFLVWKSVLFVDRILRWLENLFHRRSLTTRYTINIKWD
jgi:hypothetical protein